MNIIQIQDRLKGLPDTDLVNYVEQPMGEVPIYLALGELQRRKEMRERYQADQTPPPSVAEQLVAEAKPQPMQMGLGSMAPQAMTPVTQPAMDPRQIAASGIAANPVSNVGGPAMMAEGGIVGYQTGGSTGYSDEFIKMLEDQAKGIYPTSDFKYGINPYTQMQGYAGDAAGSFQKTFFGRNKFFPFGTEPGLGGMYSGAGRKKATEEDIAAGKEIDKLDLSQPFYGTPVPKEILESRKESKKEEAKKEEPKVEEEEVITATDADDKVRADLARIKSILGTDPERQSLEDRLADKEDRALNMALIRGGLGIAAGQSSDFLENLAKGATAGVESYAKTQEDILKAQSELAKQKRAEDLALLGKALDAEQSELDRASKETIAKYMSPRGGVDIVSKILSNNAVQRLMGQIQGFKTLQNPTKEQQAQLAKLEAELLALQRQLSGYYESQGFGAGTGQTSSLTEKQKQLLEIYK